MSFLQESDQCQRICPLYFSLLLHTFLTKYFSLDSPDQEGDRRRQAFCCRCRPPGTTGSATAATEKSYPPCVERAIPCPWQSRDRHAHHGGSATATCRDPKRSSAAAPSGRGDIADTYLELVAQPIVRRTGIGAPPTVPLLTKNKTSLP